MRFDLRTPALALAAAALLAGCDIASTLPFLNKSDAAPVQTASEDPIDQAFAEPAAVQAIEPTAEEDPEVFATEHATGLDMVISRVRFGEFLCADKVLVNIDAAPDNPREFVVRGPSFDHRLVPVETASGTVRLEDAANGIVWLQVRERAMLMNQTKGQRLAAECIHQ